MKFPFLIIMILFQSCSTYKKVIIAHRGASGYLPEHTLEGVAMAHAFNVDFIEPDLVLTKDNQLIVRHDIFLETTTNVAKLFPDRKRADGRYYAIDFNLDEIKKLSVHERTKKDLVNVNYDKRFPLYKENHFKVPLFEDYIKLVKGLNKSRKMKIGIYPELKSPQFHLDEGKDIFKIFHNKISKLNLNKNDGFLYLQCFNSDFLKRYFDNYKPQFPLIQLIGENSWEISKTDFDFLKTIEGVKFMKTYAKGVAAWIPQVVTIDLKQSQFLKYLKQNHLIIHVYTLRKDELYNPLKTFEQHVDFLFKKIEVDGIFTDHADLITSLDRINI
ncbi:MAG: glycerophosphodiester phosphodiesterase [Halobacteriovoraceae bacterium]|nr:glycerophosphodiester phosphodiesterase [Halobacteriovoraceae bacterium]